MFKFILGLIIGANLSLFLYACIIAGKESDLRLTSKENQDKTNKKEVKVE